MTELEKLEKELLEEIQEEPEIYADTEEFCTINPETRIITVPTSKRILGTESDQETNRLYFKCPKIVGDNVDLSLFSLRINYQNAGNKKDQYLVEDVKEEGDNITFSWLLKRNVTAYKGNVKFILCAVKTTEDGIIKNEWNTTLNTECESLEGMEVDKVAVEEETKDIVEQLIAMMNHSAENAVRAVEEAKAEVDKEVGDFALKAQQALADVNNAGQTQTERVQSAGTTAVESVKTAQGTATRAVETAKSEAIKAVQAEGTTQVGNVSAEGEKQVQAVRGAAQEIMADREQIQENKTGIAKLKEDIDSLELRSCGNAKEEGFTICDKDENIGVQIGSKKIWDNLPYNRKYGWGGIPYGNGELPPYSRIVGMFEADMFSVRGGKGRWNGDDTNNFKHGGHLFEGWNKEEDVRLTFGIGLKNKDISWIQTFHPATEEGTDGGAYYGVTKIGSDIDREGVDFMPTVAKSQSIICLKVGNDLVPKREHVQELVDTGELVDWEYSSSDMIPFGAMYFDYNMNKVRVYTKTGWKSLKFEEDI